MPKFNECIYKEYKIGYWSGDNNYMIYPININTPIIGENVLEIKKTKIACEKYINKLLAVQ